MADRDTDQNENIISSSDQSDQEWMNTPSDDTTSKSRKAKQWETESRKTTEKSSYGNIHVGTESKESFTRTESENQQAHSEESKLSETRTPVPESETIPEIEPVDPIENDAIEMGDSDDPASLSSGDFTVNPEKEKAGTTGEKETSGQDPDMMDVPQSQKTPIEKSDDTEPKSIDQSVEAPPQDLETIEDEIDPVSARTGGEDTGQVIEDDMISVTGTLTVTDLNPGEAYFQAGPVQGTFGTLNLSDNGSWTYTLNNTANTVQQLDAGDIVTDTITVHSADGTSHNLVMTIHGTNDTPVLGPVTSRSAAEDGSIVTGSVAATDVDADDSISYTASSADGFTFNADGSYSFDPSHSSYQALAAGETQTVTVQVTATDSQGATDTENLVITVDGTNDTPTVSGAVTLPGGTEDISYSFTADQLLANASDVDASDTLSVQNVTVDASQGILTDNNDGTYTFTSKANYNGEVTINYDVTDGTETASTTAGINLAAVNDEAIISGAGGAVKEDTTQSVTGQLSITDVDTGEDHFASETITGTYGSLEISEDGSWTYTLSNSADIVQQLDAGDTVTDTITVQSADGTTHNLVMTVNGTNDAPVLGTVTSKSATEDGSVVTGSVAAIDVDADDTLTYSSSSADGLTFDADGTYSFDPSHTSYQALAAGETQTVTVQVTATDSQGATDTESLVITVTGTNDTPTVSGAVTLPGGTEDTSYSFTADQLLANASDVDSSDTLSVQNVIVDASYGILTNNNEGTYTFTPKTNYNGEVTINYDVTDGTETVSTTAGITLSAVNDEAVITGSGGAVTEDTSQSVTGQLSIIDVDTGEDHFTAETITGTYGSLEISEDGSWTYTLSNSADIVQQLDAGDIVTDTIAIESADGTTHNLVMTVNGTNDTPVLGTVTAKTATEDSAVVTGSVTATDVDADDSISYSAAATDGLTFNADGTYSFDPSHSSYQDLAAGETQTVTVQVTATDSQGATDTENLVITVTGTNDTPTVSGAVTLPGGTEDISYSFTEDQLLANASDVNASDTLNVESVTVDASQGTLIDNNDSTYTFTPKTNYNGAVTINYDVTDGTKTVSTTAGINLAAVNDEAIISGAGGAVKEDTTQSVTGQLSITDVDTGEDHFSAETITGTYGSLEISEDGSWIYSLNNSVDNVQELDAGDTVTDTITVQSSDGTTHNLVMTVNGTNDAPVLGTVTAKTATEDGAVVTGSVTATDVDADDSISYSAATTDGLTFNADGTYSFDPSHSSYQDLAAGETQTVTVQITAADSHGTTDTENLVITVTGTNDTPTVSGAVTLPGGTEDISYSFTEDQLLANASDVDASDTLSVQSVTVDTSQGTLTDNNDGTYTFTPKANYNGAVTINYNVTDGTETVSTTAGINLAAVNDEAVITGTGGIVAEDTVQSVTGQLSITDVDTGEDHFITETITGIYGFLEVSEDGSWTYTLSNSADNVQQLDAGDTVTDTITVESADGTTHNLVMTVNGTNDAPVLGTVTAKTATEDGAVVTGSVTATDVDADDSISYSAATTDGLTFNADGTYSFDPFHSSYQALAAGETQTVTVQITATDSQGATDTENLVITVTGTNDTPTVSGAVTLPGGTEDTSYSFTSDQLLANASDVDASDTLSVQSVTVDASQGTLTDNNDGTYTFTPKANYNGEVTINYDVTDGTETVSTTAGITLSAVNDEAVITGTGSSVTEDTVQSATGQLSVTDVDTGEDHFTAETITGIYGSLEISEDGSWTYSLNNSADNVQQLDAGDTVTDTIAIESADGTTHNLVMTVNGTNDTPVLGTVTSKTATEDGSVVTGSVTATDVDADDSVTYSASSANGLTFNTNGTYSFDPSHTSYQDLAAGETQTVTVQVTATDSQGATDTENLVITVTGTNDTPTVSGAVTLPGGTEDTSYSFTADQLLANTSDVDTSDTLAVQNVTVDTSQGTLTDNNDGTFTFTPKANYNGAVTINYEVTDGTDVISTTAGINFAAVNDDPVADDDIYTSLIDPNDLGNVTVGAPSSIRVTGIYAKGSDDNLLEDKPDLVTLSDHKYFEHGSLGKTGYNYMGGHDWFKENDISLDGLKGGIITFEDGTQGIIDTASNGVEKDTNGDGKNEYEENAYIYYNAYEVENQLTTSEDTELVIESKTLLVNDSDSDGDTLSIAAVSEKVVDSSGQVVGTAKLNDEGNVVFTPGDSLDALAENENKEVFFTYTVSDGQGGTDTATVTLNIEGTNDTPIISGAVTLKEGAEDKSYTFTGKQLLANSSDVDVSDTLSVQNVAVDASLGTLTDNNDGTFTFTPKANYNGDVTITYDITDGTETVAAKAAVNLAAVNDAVGAVTDTDDSANTVAENVPDGTYTGITLNAVDVDGDTITYSVADDVPFRVRKDGSVVVDGDNQIDYETAASYTFDVTAKSSDGTVSTQSVTIKVSDIQEDTAADGVKASLSVGEAVANKVSVLDTDAMEEQGIAQGDDGKYYQTVYEETAKLMTTQTIEVGAAEKIKVDDAPRYGHIEVKIEDTWKEITEGETYPADSEFRFVPDEEALSTTSDTQIGTFGEYGGTKSFTGHVDLTDWGTVSDDNRTITFSDGDLTVTTTNSVGEFKTFNKSGESKGAGIGDTDGGGGLSNDEKMFVEIEGAEVNQVIFTLDGLGGRFDDKAGGTEVLITAYDENGNVIDSQGGFRESKNYIDTYEFTTTVPVYSFELGTNGNNGTYVVQNMTLSRTVVDEVTFTAVAEDGTELSVTSDINIEAGMGTSDITDLVPAADVTMTKEVTVVDTDAMAAKGAVKVDGVWVIKTETEVDPPMTEVTDSYTHKVEIDAQLADTDGSETLSVTVTGVPKGAKLSEGEDGGNGTWKIDVAEGETGISKDITMTVPADTGDYAMGVTALGTETSTGDTASASQTVKIQYLSQDSLAAKFSLDQSEDGVTTNTGGEIKDQAQLMDDARIEDGLLILDGDGDYLKVASSTDHNLDDVTQRTTSVWFRTDQDDGQMMVYEEGGVDTGLNIYIDNGQLVVGAFGQDEQGDKTFFFSATDDDGNPVNVADGEWHHVAVSLDGDPEGGMQMAGYLDGSHFGQVDDGIALGVHPDGTGIGGIHDTSQLADGSEVSSGLYFNGSLDDVRIYAAAFDEQGVQQLYDDMPNGVRESLEESQDENQTIQAQDIPTADDTTNTEVSSFAEEITEEIGIQDIDDSLTSQNQDDPQGLDRFSAGSTSQNTGISEKLDSFSASDGLENGEEIPPMDLMDEENDNDGAEQDDIGLGENDAAIPEESHDTFNSMDESEMAI